MTLVLTLLGLSMATELVAYITFRFKVLRWSLAILSLTLAPFAAGALLVWRPNAITVLIAAVSAYRAFNCLRLIRGRMHTAYLERATRRTGLWLMVAQLSLGGMWWLWTQSYMHRSTAWLTVGVVQLIGAVILWVSFRRRLTHTKPPRKLKQFMSAQLPSLTVAIPARNETDDLQRCLESLIASDYPKLEILVLDDCSQNKHTPEIIRSFAHAGVRFIAGTEPRLNWLAKNQAYDALLHEATGEYILFCGVDARFEAQSLRTLMTIMLRKKKAMVSILPQRQMGNGPRTSLVQSMRYWWELVPPRRLFERPAVLSTCWIAQRNALERVGGFAAVARMIVPEAYFAKAMTIGDRYSFLRSDRSLGIASTKTVGEQWHTAIRMRYPQLHRRPEQVFVTTVAEMLFLGLPFGIALLGWWYPVIPLAHIASTCAAFLLVWCYVWLSRVTGLVRWQLAVVALPVAIALDIYIAHRSMWQYEFSDVQWKGRNVCIPVMHTYSHLPEV